MMEGVIGVLVVILILFLLLWENQHKHVAARWDGYQEICSCGVNAGDQSDPETGKRYFSFSQWSQ